MTVLKTGLRSHLTSKRGQFLECRLDGIPGWFGGIGPPGWGGPPEGPVAELVDLPARVLLEPMVPPTFWPPITQARPSARFIRGVVVVVTLRGWPTAPRPSASGVSDLGQVPKLGPGIMAFGLEPVIAWPGIDGVELDQQVRPASGVRSRQVPGSAVAVKENPGPSRVAGPARFLWLLGSGRAQPCPTACPCSSVTVTHHVVVGLRAAAAARSRASHGSPNPRSKYT